MGQKWDWTQNGLFFLTKTPVVEITTVGGGYDVGFFHGHFIMVKHPHEVHATCPRDQRPVPVVKGCGMRTMTWYAEDNEVDFKEALRLVVETWNRRLQAD